MANWTDHYLVFKVKNVTTWATQAYAPTAIVRNGKVYLYFPNSGTSIGVAVADKPEGPYKDPLGKALITKSMSNCDVDWLFDPCVFVDSTAAGTQAYLTFGGGQNSSSPYGKNLRIIKLNDDMISVSGTAVTIAASNSFEASYLYKYNNEYYFCWATTGASKIDYSMSDAPTAGYTYKGTILDNPTLNGVNIDGNNNNHGGPIQYKGQWYMVYHDRRLSNNSTYKRNASCDALSYNADGTVKKVVVTAEGPAQIKKLNPYDTIQAETIWKQKGIKTDFCDEGGVMVTKISDGAYTSLKGVDFAGGAKKIEVRASSATGGGTVEVHLDSETGALVASCAVSATGGWQTWKTFSSDVANCKGVNNVFFVYKGSGEPFRLNWFKFSSLTTSAKRSAGLTAKVGQHSVPCKFITNGNAIPGNVRSAVDLSGRAMPLNRLSASCRSTRGSGVLMRREPTH
jgi:arabinoxylan arabinofuranohydrolase